MFFFVCGKCLYTGIFIIPTDLSFVAVDLHHFMGEIFQNMGHVDPRCIYVPWKSKTIKIVVPWNW